MLTLRLTQHPEEEPGRHFVLVELTGEGLTRRTADARFEFALSPQDQEDLRWYLEDYPQYPFDPAPTIAARVEGRMAEIGTELFEALFQSSDARDLWATLRDRLNDTRVEIITGVREAATIPWELLRDPRTDTPLALRARAFVRAHPNPSQFPSFPETPSGPIRILLVICRPAGERDVPFRSVASRLIKGLSEDARALFQLDLLRPPTFERLGQVLRQAKAEEQPYHVVHFDGHGAYEESAGPGTLAEILRGLGPLVLSGQREGAHGYLLFENPQLAENAELVDGSTVGKLLAETDVPVLVLNACRSAHAEPPEAPQTVDGEAAAAEEADPHAQVRALGSLAQEVMEAGVAGVVAMRYNVYAVAAAQFVADLYASLAQGRTLGEAVTLGRKQLHAQPLREVALAAIRLQDWPVPVVYEAAPMSLFPRPAAAAEEIAVTIHAADATPERGVLDPELPKPPDVGFFGRDETVLALDRAFDDHPIVLLHAYAGSGKTATAAEFARWYALTGGVEGPVLFTTFEQHKPLPRVLDRIGQVFGGALEQAGVHWLALDDAQRREEALQLFRQVPVLWIWDNVEPITGFPAGTPSAWSEEEQKELADFLREVRGTKARFLLASRRDERTWLGELPARITIPPMPMPERVLLARALAEKQGRRLADVQDWRPLLRFTEGNPLTITVVVGQALRDGLESREQIEAFVDQLRAGQAAFEDERSEGRARSLGASLGYGFEHAFEEPERKQLALLHFFQGFVDVRALRSMGHPEAPWCLPEVRGLTREAGMALLDRAAEVGLLAALGGGYYRIHPALPWYFRGLFDEHYPTSPSPGGEPPALGATRAFVEAMGVLGSYYADEYERGNRDVVHATAAEEANLLHARHLARRHGWWRAVIQTMQGLRRLYDQTGRRGEWARLVEEIVPDFVDPATDGPLPGREEDWGLVTEYRARLAREAREWAEAERLQRVRVAWNRQRATLILDVPPEALSAEQRHAIRTLAVSLHELGQIQRELSRPECVEAYEESLALAERIGERAGAASCAANLGHAYLLIPALRDLEQAERWYRRSLELSDERDRLGRGGGLTQLGLVALERFREAREAGRPEPELLRHLNDAAEFYHQALGLIPSSAVGDLAVVHHQLGIIYRSAGDLDQALPHYRESIRYEERQGNLYGAAQTRFNVARALVGAGRFADALLYAQAARRNYETYDDRAAEEIQRTQRLIEEIEKLLKAKGG